MKRFIPLLFLLALAAACDEAKPAPAPPEVIPEWVKEAQERSAAQAEAPPPVPDVPQVVDKPLLWSVTSPTGATSHLLGTYHIGTDFPGLPALPPAVRTAFESSTDVVLEADVGAPPTPQMSKFTMLQGPKTLKSMLKPSQWDTLLTESGLPPRQLERLRPHVAVSVMTAKWTPDASVRGMDGRFMILARAHDKPLTYLETPEFQLEMMSEQLTLPMLAALLDDVPAAKAAIEELRQGFVAGDAAKMEELVFKPEELAAYKGFHDAIFWRRNADWVPKLKPLLDAGGAFVAVGAGHLLGPRSLVVLLGESGYEVARVDP